MKKSTAQKRRRHLLAGWTVLGALLLFAIWRSGGTAAQSILSPLVMAYVILSACIAGVVFRLSRIIRCEQ